MKVLTVIGNRPQFVKAAAVSPLLRTRAQEVLVHTGQHFDDRLSAIFFSELGLPAPDIELNVSGGSNASQTGRMLSALEPVMEQAKPDLVLVYGDTNSTLAGALAAVSAKLPVVHVEAGMRSFDRSMPEETNRVATDHLSSLLLCSTADAVAKLAVEGIGSRPGAKVEVVGDVMVDVAAAVQRQARGRVELVRAHAVEPGEYLLVTAHRAGNVDDHQRLVALVELLVGLHRPIVFPVHPRTRARLRESGLFERLAGCAEIHLCEPVGYVELAALLCNASAALTDSGGLQKEAYLAGVCCLTLRANTEWTETVETGWNTLVDLNLDLAKAALTAPLPTTRPQLYGDGQAGARVVDALLDFAGA